MVWIEGRYVDLRVTESGEVRGENVRPWLRKKICRSFFFREEGKGSDDICVTWHRLFSTFDLLWFLWTLFSFYFSLFFSMNLSGIFASSDLFGFFGLTKCRLEILLETVTPVLCPFSLTVHAPFLYGHS